ncbi:MAG: TPM domain-containing protein [Deltaproteobacteria bacterium]|nr:TPM domain-containing protein [Deltaproteobacteria bacterium]
MKRLLILAILLLVPLPLTALDAPPLKGRVNDYAGMLSPQASANLERKLADFERETTNQIVVLTVPSLEGDDIDVFSIRVADAWKVGQKGKDNGVILILAQAERKVRIEVGMGLQGVLTDLTAGRIIRDVMRPSLRDGDFNRGVEAGIEAVMAATKGEFKATPGERKQRTRQSGASSFLTFLIFAGVAAVVLGAFSRWLGGLAGGAGLPLAAAMAFPGLAPKYLLVLGALGLAAGFLLSSLARLGRGGGHGGGGSYWGGGGFGGGGFSSGGGFFDGGGGFSGGGGGFDGGGASDGW